MTYVVHINKAPYDVYIGRGSKWGNPFKIGEHGTRAEVIDRYDEYIRASPDLLASLHELDGKILGCFCNPQACHGDKLIEIIKERKLFDF